MAYWIFSEGTNLGKRWLTNKSSCWDHSSSSLRERWCLCCCCCMLLLRLLLWSTRKFVFFFRRKELLLLLLLHMFVFHICLQNYRKKTQNTRHYLIDLRRMTIVIWLDINKNININVNTETGTCYRITVICTFGLIWLIDSMFTFFSFW